jgi:DNA-directed RNA polymerase specialized sigma24 family protein
MDALARLGRQVEPAPAEDPAGDGANERPEQARSASTEGLNEVELTVRLVESTLNAAPPEERNALESNIWLLIRGRNTELIERLGAGSAE